MEQISLGNALKHARHMIHKHPYRWNVVIMCENWATVFDMYREVGRILHASSLQVEQADDRKHIIRTAKGGRFDIVRHPETLREREVTQLIWLYKPDPEDRAIARSRLRSMYTEVNADLIEQFADV